MNGHGPLQAKEAERLCFAFVLYCAVKLKGRKEGSGVRLCEILKSCKLKWVMLHCDYLGLRLVIYRASSFIELVLLAFGFGLVCRYDDFFKEMQQLGLKIEKILESRYGRDWEGQLEVG